MAASPGSDPNRTFSAAQVAQQEKFREALSYAIAAKDEEVYVARAKGTPRNPQNVAMADFFHPPDVTEVDVANWHGRAGQVIRVRASDDVQVTQVNVVITSPAGAILEQGAAVKADANWWEYTTTAAAPDGSNVVAAARDLP